MPVAQLLKDHSHLFDSDKGTILDLACGKGQNGLYLVEQKIKTLFADINPSFLNDLIADHHIDKAHCWLADFESTASPDALKLDTMQLQAVIVFRYLHRPLFNAIKQAVKPGGYVIYETFTQANKEFGRPHREAFLLAENELKRIFNDWNILHYFEGIESNPNRAIAQIVCQKPHIK
jgi:SAM-dependent methyltransferase